MSHFVFNVNALKKQAHANPNGETQTKWTAQNENKSNIWVLAFVFCKLSIENIHFALSIASMDSHNEKEWNNQSCSFLQLPWGCFLENCPTIKSLCLVWLLQITLKFWTILMQRTWIRAYNVLYYSCHFEIFIKFLFESLSLTGIWFQ